MRRYWHVTLWLCVSARTAIGKSLMRERLQLGANQWSLNQQLAFLSEGGAEWGGRRRKAISGATAVRTFAMELHLCLLNNKNLYLKS